MHARAASLARRAGTRQFTRRSHLRIVAVNDVYELGNLPRLATLVAERRREQLERGGAFFTTIAGDFVSPSVLSGLDKGRSMVSTLNGVPIDYACFGNHEADIPLPDLGLRTEEFNGVWLNSNVPAFEPALPPFAIVDVPAANARVGLIGLLTSERGIFRKDKMRGLSIEPTGDAAARWSALLRAEHGCTAVVALTHQSVGADVDLVEGGAVDLVLGGHEHEVILIESGKAPIVKAGEDASQAAVVDLTFGADGGAPTISIAFEDVAPHAPAPALAAEVDAHQHVLRVLEQEMVCSVNDTACSGAGAELTGSTLSSVGTRLRQTTVGALLCSAIRDVLEADVALINGGSIKGGKEYPGGGISYLDLKRELPFPTKLVVVGLPGSVLQAAVRESRVGVATDAREVGTAERRAFLQVDAAVAFAADDPHRIVAVGGVPFDAAAEYAVALPRNLLKGAFQIDPLVEFAEAHPEAMPHEDNMMPALEVVIMNQAKELFRRLGSFDEMDLDGNGVLDQEEIRAGLERKLGAPPSDTLLAHLMRSLDHDASGGVTREEFEAGVKVKDVR